jgi:hypothetical protein
MMSIVLKALNSRGRIAASAALMVAVAATVVLAVSRAAAADAFGQAETLLESPGMPGTLAEYLKDSTGDRRTDAGRTAAANAVRVAGDFLKAPPRGPVVHYAVQAMSGVQRLPYAYPADGVPGAAVAIVAARGEYEPGSFVVCALDDLGKCDFAVGPLKTEDGVEFPAADLDLRLVKVWYQNRNAWFNYFGDTGFKLVPELLLHDEDLIRVDESQEANYARITPPGGGRPEDLWINPPRQMNRRFFDHYRQTYTFAPMKPGFADAASLRPVALPRGRFVQFFLTAHVREDVQPGTYSGAIGISKQGKTLASVPVTLRVLPFVLPAPKAYGDPQRDFLVASYTYINIDMIKEENGGDAQLARRQLVAILRDHVAHGQTMHWNRGNCNAETLEAIAAMKEAGMRTDVLLGGLSPPHNAQGSPRDLALAARRQREWFDRHVGHHNVFIGYGDEPGAKWLVNARPVFEAYQREGFKFILAGGNSVFYKTGYVFDWHNVAKDPTDDSSTRLWNQVHHAHVAWYAVQHVGAENPDYNRRQNGLLPYLSGYSALCNYAHHLGPYNDDATTYRPMVFVYGTVDGVIDTLQWEGFREGVDDIRYATLLHGLGLKAATSTNLDTVYAGRKALQWFALFDKDSADLSTARLEMIRMIIQLASLPGVR